MRTKIADRHITWNYRTSDDFIRNKIIHIALADLLMDTVGAQVSLAVSPFVSPP
ncbi:MAG: hypothetical protein AAGK00_12060 [Pseudomonadota bacterium]